VGSLPKAAWSILVGNTRASWPFNRRCRARALRTKYSQRISRKSSAQRPFCQAHRVVRLCLRTAGPRDLAYRKA
jgi:hypothetical protein